MTRKLISDKKLSTIKALLPHGSSKIIAEKLGCRVETVSRVLSGKSIYPGIIEEALKIVKRQKALVRKVNKALQP